MSIVFTDPVLFTSAASSCVEVSVTMPERYFFNSVTSWVLTVPLPLISPFITVPPSVTP